MKNSQTIEKSVESLISNGMTMGVQWEHGHFSTEFFRIKLTFAEIPSNCCERLILFLKSFKTENCVFD